MSTINKDWKGNSVATMATLASRNNALEPRQYQDYYATNPKAIDFLFESLPVLKLKTILEPCAGQGHLVQAMRNHGATVKAQELYERPDMLIKDCEFNIDFLDDILHINYDINIITNPPYRYAEQFIRQSLKIIAKDCYVAMFLPIRYLEGKARRKLFDEYPPYQVIVSSSRLGCAKNGEFDKYSNSAQAYAWFVWQKNYNGNSILKWGN